MVKKLWGGRFKKKADPAFESFSNSLSYDKRLAEFDCLAGIAHARMLRATGVLTVKERDEIVTGLTGILSAVKSGKVKFDISAEDVHTAVQQALLARIGTAADKIHIARSRNDLVAADLRMYCKKEIGNTISGIKGLQRSILHTAQKYEGVIMPGYTHTMHAQPILFPHLLLAYLEMFERDIGRLADASKRSDELPLGSCALSGTSIPIDRDFLAKELKFSRLCNNSIDAVSDRDFLLEFLAALSILSIHMSRLAEDMILYSSDEFGFVKLDEAYCTGSSIMPHKKNPDSLELVRGESAGALGNLVSALAMMKGLPMSYNRDMQLDKKFLFASADAVGSALAVMAGVMGTLALDEDAIAEGLIDEFLFTADLAEYLMKKGLSHREAHDAVSRLVLFCSDMEKNISELDLKTLKDFSKKFDRDVYRIFNKKVSVGLKSSYGGTSPANVRRELNRWKKALSK